MERCIPLPINKGENHFKEWKIILVHIPSRLNAVCISDDSTLLAGSFNDSIVRVWTLTPKKLCALKSPSQMQQITLAAGDVTKHTLKLHPYNVIQPIQL